MSKNYRATLKRGNENYIIKSIKGVFINIDKKNELIHFYGNNKELLGIDKDYIVILIENLKRYCSKDNLDLFRTLICDENNDYREIEIRYTNNRNEKKCVEIYGKVVKVENTVIGFEGYVADITYSLENNKCIFNKNTRDKRVGLNNSIYSNCKAEKYLSGVDKYGKKENRALIILGLDNFKYINDSFGKKYGDYF